MSFQQIHPMGAVAVKGEKLETLYKDDNYIAQEKFDGSRYVFQVRTEGCMFSSRTESVKGGQVDKAKNVPHICEEALKLLPPNTVLDGEVDVPVGRNFKRVQGIMGSLPERALALQKDDPLVYKVFDILELNGENLRTKPLKERLAILGYVFTQMNNANNYLRLCEVTTGEANKRALFEKAMEEKAEGIMLKNLNSIYQDDKSPANTWVKVKHEATYDGIVKGYKFGEQEVTKVEPRSLTEDNVYVTGWMYICEKGKYKVGDKIMEGLGTLTTYQYVDGVLTEVADVGGIPYKLRAEYKARLDKGEEFTIEFKANELFEDTHRYRHPAHVRERLDKPKEGCIYGKG